MRDPESRTPLRLLLIEDAGDDLEMVVRTITRAGYEVSAECIHSLDALRAALDRQAWDVVIADYTMARFSAIMALRILKERDADVPFLFLSGTRGEESAVAAMKLGAHDYIMKDQVDRLGVTIERELREATVRRERRRTGQRLAHLAYHDPLTDLPNRVLLSDRLEQAARSASREEKPLALLLADLDGFKQINDTLGHHAGDRVLQHVAANIRSTLRDVDTVARLGGDEFAIVLPLTDVEGATLAAEKVQREVGRPLIVYGTPAMVKASIGIVCCPEHGTSADLLLQKADVAMYLAKSSGTGIQVYAADRDGLSHRRLTFIAELQEALDAREFFLEYEPIVQLKTRAVVGIEALVRWDHPTRGRLALSDFIEVAEHTGLAAPLALLAVDMALDEWGQAGLLVPLAVRVNLSARNLLDVDLPERIASLLNARSAEGSGLTLEIPEQALPSDPARSMESLTELRRMGVRLAIDNFGSGYCSLRYLGRLPVDELKLDHSFLADLSANHDEAILRSAIDVAHNLGLIAVADGVENVGTLDALAKLQCDAVQGPFIRPAASAAITRNWIVEQGVLGLL